MATYLEDRLDVLISQVAGAVEFYLHKDFISRAIDGQSTAGRSLIGSRTVSTDTA